MNLFLVPFKYIFNILQNSQEHVKKGNTGFAWSYLVALCFPDEHLPPQSDFESSDTVLYTFVSSGHLVFSKYLLAEEKMTLLHSFLTVLSHWHGMPKLVMVDLLTLRPRAKSWETTGSQQNDWIEPKDQARTVSYIGNVPLLPLWWAIMTKDRCQFGLLSKYSAQKSTQAMSVNFLNF